MHRFLIHSFDSQIFPIIFFDDLSKLLPNSEPFAVSSNSKIYKVVIRNPKTQKEEDYSLEVFESGSIQSKAEKDNFLKSVNTQSSLRHVAILPLLKYSIPLKNDGNFKVLTPFMSHGDLGKLLEQVSVGNAPDNWETFKSIIIFGVAAGMAYIHQHDIINRNLKPEHILLDDNYYPKINDFNLSEKLVEGTEKDTQQTILIGTPIYLAPEVIEGAHYSNKIDVFSFSMILYYLLTLRKPWSDKIIRSANSLFTLIKNGERPVINDDEMNNSFRDLIEKCWNGDPDVRPSFIQIVELLMDKKEEFFDLDQIDLIYLDEYISVAVDHLQFDNS